MRKRSSDMSTSGMHSARSTKKAYFASSGAAPCGRKFVAIDIPPVDRRTGTHPSGRYLAKACPPGKPHDNPTVTPPRYDRGHEQAVEPSQADGRAGRRPG